MTGKVTNEQAERAAPGPRRSPLFTPPGQSIAMAQPNPIRMQAV